LKGQVVLFAAALRGKPSNRSLFLIVAGAGDYLRPTPLDPTEVVANIGSAIERLHQLGARDVMVLNLPDLGQVPLFAGTPQAGLLTTLTLAHNAALATKVGELTARLPRIKLMLVDLNAVLQQLPAAVDRTIPAMDTLLPPGPGGVPASACLFVNPADCRDVPTFDVGLQHLYWDAEHPTTAVHRLLAEHLFDVLSQ
jgi:phospholipase/lecithinase/hemolysin